MQAFESLIFMCKMLQGRPLTKAALKSYVWSTEEPEAQEDKATSEAKATQEDLKGNEASITLEDPEAQGTQGFP